jgi:hypothetical protein
MRTVLDRANPRVHVRVDQAGQHRGAVDHHLDVAVETRSHGHDNAALDGDVGSREVRARPVEDLTTGEHDASHGSTPAAGRPDDAGSIVRRNSLALSAYFPRARRSRE